MDKRELVIDENVCVDLTLNVRVLLARKVSSFFLYNDIKGSNFLRKNLCEWLLPDPKGPSIVSTIYGIKMLVDPIYDSKIGKHIYYFGEYEAGTIYIIKHILTADDIFLDAGSSLGLMSLVASKIVENGDGGCVYAFEPFSWANEKLRYNVKLNNAKNISIFDYALGSSFRRAQLLNGLDGNPGSASLVYTERREIVEEVQLTSIDQLLREEQIRAPTVMKVDVEGYELEVLKGSIELLSSGNPPILIIEFSNLYSQYGGTLLDLYQLITKVYGNQIYRLRFSKSMPSKLTRVKSELDLPKHDNLFCFPPKLSHTKILEILTYKDDKNRYI